MDDGLAVVLIIVGLLILERCFALWVQSRAAVVHNNHHHAVDEAEGSCPGRDMDRIVSTPQGMTGRCSTAVELNSKVTCRGDVRINKAGDKREVSVDLFFKLNCTTTERHTKVLLTLDQVDMYINNCCTKNCSSVKRSCDESCCALFIHKITIKVRPTSWAQHCHRVQLEPHLMPGVHGLQRNSGYSSQMSIGNPIRGSVTYQNGKSVSRETPAFGWAPASINESSKSSTWEWKLSRFADGSELVFNKRKTGPMRQLGIQPSHVHYPPRSFEAKACWELPPNEGMQQQLPEWGMKVRLHIALPKRHTYGHSITEGTVFPFKKVLTFS